MSSSDADRPRYAIYFVPPAESHLYRFGVSVLGYDCYGGADMPFRPPCATYQRPWADVAREPGKYGFHATLKAPFRLAAGVSEVDLAEAVGRFARMGRAIPIVDLDIRSLGAFVAMTPRARCEPLQQLAADCVTAFDSFRAPLSQSERARRRPERLTEAQVAHLDRWGYPYVFDEFRFHMTLTGPVPAPAEREEITAMLQASFAQDGCDGRVAIDRLSVLRQDTPSSRFVLVQQWPLKAAV